MTRRERYDIAVRRLGEQGGKCAYCDRPVHFPPKEGVLAGISTATADHVVPTAKGGPDAPCNIVAACPHCNQIKADFTPADLRRMADRIEELTARLSPMEMPS